MPPPPGGIELYAGAGGIAIVGESNYRDALVQLTGGQRREGVKQYLTAALVPEPTNRYDSNAISVRIGGQLVGYLSKGDAFRYKTVFDRLMRSGRTAYCSAQVRAGWDRGGGDRGDFSVTVYVDSPERQMALLNRELGMELS